MEKVRLNARVASIEPSNRSIVLDGGERIEFEHLLSTIPVDRCAALVPELPASLKGRASELLHSSSNIVGVGIKGRPKPELETKCWMYFPESDCPFYRVTLFSRYSPRNVPDPEIHFSLMTETSESPKKVVDHRTLVDETIRGLRNTRLIGEHDQVVSTWSYRAEYGYPTPSIDRDAILADVIPALEKLGVWSRGRFGGWKYEVSNQDHTFMQGVEWASRMVEGTPETTFTLG
jgi:protoporphyrinogen oxidase